MPISGTYLLSVDTGGRKWALPENSPDQPLLCSKLHLDLGGEGPGQEEEGGARLQAHQERRGGEEWKSFLLILQQNCSFYMQ